MVFNGEVTIIPFFLEQSVNDPAVCNGVKTGITGCSDLNFIPEQDFQFIYRKCRTPVVTSVDVSEGFIDQEITITGDGKSSVCKPTSFLVGNDRTGCTNPKKQPPANLF